MIKLTAFSDEASSNFSEQTDALVKSGIKYMDMRGADGKNVKDFTDAQIKEYKNILSGDGISVCSIGSPLGKVDINLSFSEYTVIVKRVFDIAKAFDCENVRIFSFFNAYSQRSKVLDYLNEMTRIAQSYGLRLYHENEKDVYGDTAERVKDIMTNVGGMKFIYDPANFLQCGEDSEKTLPLCPYCDYYHIKDLIKKTGEVVPAGYGDGKIKDIFSAIDVDITASIEPHLRVFEGFSSFDKTQLKNKFTYGSSGEAFSEAVNAFKALLSDIGYKFKDGYFVKG